MQNNKTLEKEIESNSNTVFMSEALDELLSEDIVSHKNAITCCVKSNNGTINFDLLSKETLEDFSIIRFICKVDSVLMLEKGDILDIGLLFEKVTFKSFSKDRYTFE